MRAVNDVAGMACSYTLSGPSRILRPFAKAVCPMSFLDKRSILAKLDPDQPVAIELGCGPFKRDPASLGIDSLDYPGVDLVGDVFEVLAAFPVGSVGACHSSHFLEHLPDTGRLLDELGRVMGPGACFEVTVPHFSNPYFHSDPTHSRSFGLYTMSYFARDELLRRKVPSYGREAVFALEAVKLGFDSPFPLRGVVRRFLGWWLNRTVWLQEFYEENLSGLFSCYEITYRLRRL